MSFHGQMPRALGALRERNSESIAISPQENKKRQVKKQAVEGRQGAVLLQTRSCKGAAQGHSTWLPIRGRQRPKELEKGGREREERR